MRALVDVFFLLQNPAMELSKYQTLPGKRSKKSELNGNREVDGEYLSPVQLSPVHSHDQDYTLSEFLLHQSKWGAWSLFHFLCSYLFTLCRDPSQYFKQWMLWDTGPHARTVSMNTVNGRYKLFKIICPIHSFSQTYSTIVFTGIRTSHIQIVCLSPQRKHTIIVRSWIWNLNTKMKSYKRNYTSIVDAKWITIMQWLWVPARTTKHDTLLCKST